LESGFEALGHLGRWRPGIGLSPLQSSAPKASSESPVHGQIEGVAEAGELSFFQLDERAPRSSAHLSTKAVGTP
jgi:hypothetical protein